MSGRRVRDRRIVFRCRDSISKAEIRQSILKYLLQEYDIQKHTLLEHNVKEHSLQEHFTGAETGRGSGSNARDRD